MLFKYVEILFFFKSINLIKAKKDFNKSVLSKYRVDIYLFWSWVIHVYIQNKWLIKVINCINYLNNCLLKCFSNNCKPISNWYVTLISETSVSIYDCSQLVQATSSVDAIHWNKLLFNACYFIAVWQADDELFLPHPCRDMYRNLSLGGKFVKWC